MRSLFFAAALATAGPALAQHAGHGGHEGHGVPAPVDAHAGHAMPAPANPAPVADPHAGHAMPAPANPSAAADPHAGHAMPSLATKPGSAPAPTPPTDRYADRFWSPEAMARSRAQLHAEHGGQSFSQLMIDTFEVQPEGGEDGYRFDAEAWFGGDIHRLVLKGEGEGSFGETIEGVELQALYGRAIDPYWNLQAGIRHDIRPDPERTYAVIGVEGLAPYWFDVEGALFLSDEGDLHARVEARYDQRLTQRVILQPRAELNFAGQDVPELGIGSGLSDIELGLRLRYEVIREFAPYVGVNWARKIGDSARFARADGESPTSAGILVGVRFWF